MSSTSTTTTITPLYFIKQYINNSTKVSSTKIDKTIKYLINTLNTMLEIRSSSILIDYLNNVRIVYFIKRLKYYDFKQYLELTSKYSTLYFRETLANLFSLDLLYKSSKNLVDLDLDLRKFIASYILEDSSYKEVFLHLNFYLLRYSYYFKDLSKLKGLVLEEFY